MGKALFETFDWKNALKQENKELFLNQKNSTISEEIALDKDLSFNAKGAFTFDGDAAFSAEIAKIFDR